MREGDCRMRSSVALVSNCSSEIPLICGMSSCCNLPLSSLHTRSNSSNKMSASQAEKKQLHLNELVVSKHAAGAIDGPSRSHALHEHPVDARCTSRAFTVYNVTEHCS